ncbi:hypothetical protein PILCRDRAFT_93269 [Piloderma croceum F 1598]|uniref:Uncharacterized protein n=1 Tax=Piloderma croceum (strain F 1598) TaxID=765440 RepID=A0A0C3B6G8_PILCF|nr:hypothetical protein PILCRDRAFT_93269 [Piloderma croceum F 1598]
MALEGIRFNDSLRTSGFCCIQCKTDISAALCTCWLRSSLSLMKTLWPCSILGLWRDYQNPFDDNFTNSHDYPLDNAFGDNPTNSHDHPLDDVNDLFARGPNVFNYDHFSSADFLTSEVNDLITPGRDGQEDAVNAGSRGSGLSVMPMDDATASWGNAENSSYASSSGMTDLGFAFQGLFDHTVNTLGVDGNLWRDIITVNDPNIGNMDNMFVPLPQFQYGQMAMHASFPLLDAPTDPLEGYPELPTTIDPRPQAPQARRRSLTPEQPSKRGRFSNPRKSPGRSRASPPSYRFASPQVGGPRASTSKRNQDDGSVNQSDPLQTHLPEEFGSRLSAWKAEHGGDGLADILDIVKRDLHDNIMKYFFLTWNKAFYTKLLADGVQVWLGKNPGKDDLTCDTDIYTAQVKKELRGFIIGYEAHLRGGDKSKGMSAKPAYKRRSTKPPAAHYDIIQHPANDEEIEHNRQVVQRLLKDGLLPFAHIVEGDKIDKRAGGERLGNSWKDKVPGYVIPYAASIAFHCLSHYKSGVNVKFDLNHTNHMHVFKTIEASFKLVEDRQATHDLLTRIYEDAVGAGPKIMTSFAVKTDSD